MEIIMIKVVTATQFCLEFFEATHMRDIYSSHSPRTGEKGAKNMTLRKTFNEQILNAVGK